MKRLIIFILLGISTLATANDAAIEGYVHAQQQMLQAQINQMHAAINLMNSSELSDQEKFERIGEPSFAAISKALAAAGFTVKQFYQFSAEHETKIAQWLVSHGAEAEYIRLLMSEQDRLNKSYELMINRTIGAAQ